MRNIVPYITAILSMVACTGFWVDQIKSNQKYQSNTLIIFVLVLPSCYQGFPW